MIALLMYLGFCLTNALVYTFAKYFSLQDNNLNTTLAMLYMNIVSMFVMMPYFIKNTKKVLGDFKSNSKLLLSSPAGILKIVAIQHIAPKNAMTISFLTPLMVTLLSFLLLKEFSQNSLKSLVFMAFSFFGALVFIGLENVKLDSFWYIFMLMHVILKSLIHIFFRKLAKKDKTVTLFYSVAFNLLSTFLFSKYKGYSVDLKYCLDYRIIAIGTISVFCQFALLYAYKITAKISSLQNFDFSRVLFTCLLSYFMLGQSIKSQEYLGMIIIFCSMIAARHYQKKHKIAA